jgi:hypothetical protein
VLEVVRRPRAAGQRSRIGGGAVRRFGITAAAGVVLALSVAGCGSSTSGTRDRAQPATSSPSGGGGSTSTKAPSSSSSIGIKCPTAETVSTIVGHDVAVKGEQGSKYCEYKFEDNDANSISVIYVLSNLDVTQDPGGSAVPVSGIGQRANWDKENGNLTVWTGKAGLVLTVFTIGFPDLDQKAAAIKLAKLVL